MSRQVDSRDDLSIGLFCGQSFDSLQFHEVRGDTSSVASRQRGYNRNSLGSFNVSPIKVECERRLSINAGTCDFSNVGYPSTQARTTETWAWLGPPVDPRQILCSLSFLFEKFEYLLVDMERDQSHMEAHRNSDFCTALRRIDSAVCGFGGTALGSRRSSQSIFRLKSDGSKDEYETVLRDRYHLEQNKISWGLEENPPVKVDNAGTVGQPLFSENQKKSPTACSRKILEDTESESRGVKYLCKLCKQPKQNHICPYEKSMQRSIGVMVYPAVNSFASDEPGTIAAPLSKMNNYTYNYDLGENNESPCASQTFEDTITVTPESLRAHGFLSGLTGPSTACNKRKMDDWAIPKVNKVFVSSVRLRPEQYRSVENRNLGAFRYPSIPLTFPERKKLSDSLFYLAKEVPELTAGCASLLRIARQRNDWDQAVAELLVQFVIGCYCSQTDFRLDGLQQYMLALGISC